jgi:hypothetical protein
MVLFILALIFLIIGYGLIRLARFMGKLQEVGRLAEEQEEYEYQKALEQRVLASKESELDKLVLANKARLQKKQVDSMLDEVMNTPLK